MQVRRSWTSFAPLRAILFVRMSLNRSHDEISHSLIGSKSLELFVGLLRRIGNTTHEARVLSLLLRTRLTHSGSRMSNLRRQVVTMLALDMAFRRWLSREVTVFSFRINRILNLGQRNLRVWPRILGIRWILLEAACIFKGLCHLNDVMLRIWNLRLQMGHNRYGLYLGHTRDQAHGIINFGL